MTQDPTQRFSNRVDHYVRARPGYPAALIGLLRDKVGLTVNQVLADVGSGTGLLTRVFLENGNRVIGIEPNREMREAGDRFLSAFKNFKGIDARAEATTLADETIDGIIAGQAFHWFDPIATRQEFRRILKPAGWVSLIWNERRIGEEGFDAAYEALAQEFTIDRQVAEKRGGSANVAAAIAQFAGASPLQTTVLDNHQDCDLEAVISRVLSSSYMPLEGPIVDAMLARLRELFNRHQQGGVVRLNYVTRVYYGQIG